MKAFPTEDLMRISARNQLAGTVIEASDVLVMVDG